MKKIINGKMYNTETANRIAGWDNGLGSSDFRSVDETLYRKKTGEFFLHGIGGAMTRYARSCGENATCCGEGIVPLSIEEAKSWVEEHCRAERYEEVFGVAEE
mgnify:CR=1 FL=1